ncbi:hypothetical protein ACS0PU_009458 [Formica fusca]
MFNAQKRNPFVSKRHARRIIENETNIDIAGSSKHILKLPFTPNISFKDYDLDSYKNCNENIPASIENINNDRVDIEITSFEDENHYQQCLNNNNIQRNNDDYDDDDNENDDHDFHNPVIEIISEAFNNVDDDKKFKNAIATWAISYNINHNACNALLQILLQHTSCNFPKDIRTLVRTPRQVQIISACGGEYFYLGLDDIIKNMLLRSYEKYINLL